MFERFIERARQVVVLAQDEARLLKHNYIGTEHLLLGLLRAEEGLAARVLAVFDVRVEEVRVQVARRVGRGDEVATGQIRLRLGRRRRWSWPCARAQSLGHKYIDTEHILLGLARVNQGVAARILLDFDADAETIRNEVIRFLSGAIPSEPTAEERIRRLARKAARERGTPRLAQLVIDCPTCATPIEITADVSNTKLNLSAEDNRTCPGCGKQWRISYTVSWEEQPPPTGPPE